MFHKKAKSEGQSNERWLLTYSDLITLLMVFFIVMYASSTINAAKYQELKESLGQVLNPGSSEAVDPTFSAASPITPAALTKPAAEQADLNDIAAQLNTYLNDNNLQDSISVNVTQRGVVVSLKDSVLFDPGSIEIKPNINAKLVAIGKVLVQMNNYIRVEGNTDNVPMKGSTIKNNWQLSVLRATQVLQVLVNQSGVPPQRISSIGYGEYRPAAPNTTSNNKAKNRRVDIVILSDIYNKSEASSADTPPAH